ncbi:MAG: class II fructose-bisphosphate aldolase [Chloroflexi bacterium]|nr:class II fructose-bisphosphate aldolase [Chloroflexota bacterium]
MTLVSALGELKKAQQGGYAVPCFDTFEMQGTRGIFAALESRRAPGIIGLYTRLLDEPHGRALTQFVRVMAEEATVPVSIMLDHGASFEHCVRALTFGFTDVMYDGSKLSLEENVAATRQIVQAAHAVGAAVEAELGHVGSGSEYQEFGGRGQGFTDPAAVERFVAATGVDALAVAIGTAHGQYAGEPRLDLALLDEIRRRVEIPLVLHGGSGLSDAQFQAAIRGGVAKINIFTNLALEATRRVAQRAAQERPSFGDITEPIREAFQDECARFLDVFLASGRS